MKKQKINYIARLFPFILVLFLTTQCSVQKKGVTQSISKKTEKITKEAQKLHGVKYKYAGKTPKTGFDCSGFVAYVFEKVDVALSGSSTDQSKKGKKVSLKELKKGDLMFFKGRNTNSKKVGHVAIVVENKSGKIKITHATSSKGVMTQTYNDSPYWTSRFLFGRRILN